MTGTPLDAALDAVAEALVTAIIQQELTREHQ